MFNHPDYEKHFDLTWDTPKLGLERVVLFYEFYALAERQNAKPNLSGDIAAEGEWISQLVSIPKYQTRSLEPNASALESALRLWREFCIAAAKHNPKRLKPLYLNLIEGGTYNFVDPPEPPMIWNEEPAWYEGWEEEFMKIEPKIMNIFSYQQAHAAFFGVVQEYKQPGPHFEL